MIGVENDVAASIVSGNTTTPLLYRELPTRRARWVRGAATAFTLYHVLAMILGGAVKDVRDKFAPAFGFYDQGLHMTNSWGMFGKPPDTSHVIVEGERADGSMVTLLTSVAQSRSLLERIRDVRVRKIQTKLTDGGERARWGYFYLEHFCTTERAAGRPLRSVRAVQLVHELRDDAGRVTRQASRRTLMARTCSAGAASDGRASPAEDSSATGSEGRGDL
ncbi:MAG: hypothetical protein U0271_22885 [Polyangiaceae bacterium]